ncbi:MAG: hypothetical protein HC923_10945 [Myxococcales bacterium]|nr:hypothetical protein [Myxococcales bacterium]
MRVLQDDPRALVLGLPDMFGVDWVCNHYKDVLEEELRRLNPAVQLKLQLADTKLADTHAEIAAGDEPPEAQLAAPEPEAFVSKVPGPMPRRELADGPISDRYTFANFITGPSNQLAAAAAHTVSENPGRAYNPLFVFGRVGLGKTHLIHAVGHSILRKNPNAKVQYQTTEQFVNDVVQGIQTKRMPELDGSTAPVTCS